VSTTIQLRKSPITSELPRSPPRFGSALTHISESIGDPLQRTPVVATAPGVGKCLKTSFTSSNTRLSRFAGFDV
jgi:hypothetical protein